jgi:hypothetical protein
MTKIKQTKSTAKDVFSYLLMIITLIMNVVAFISLVFMYVEYQFPFMPDMDIYYRSGLSEGIRVCMSVLFIAWPVFVFLSWFILKELKKEKTKAEIWVRKWLLHFALFASALAIIVDLITLINFFLDGELTVRFVLKFMTVLLVAAVLFGYYLWDLKRVVSKETKVPMVSAIVGTVVVLGFIILGFVIVGTPADQRDERMDVQRLEDVQDIQNMIEAYWSEEGELPSSIVGLGESLYGVTTPVDPETGESYPYLIQGDLTYQLCATFEKSSKESTYYDSSYSKSRRLKGVQNWSHDVGIQCYDLEIDPEEIEKEIYLEPVYID